MKVAIFVALSFLVTTSATGFSAAGHEAVCEIAYLELTTEAKEAVDKLIDTETDDRFKTFRDACVWPDTISGGPTEDRGEDHYINVPRTWHYIRYEKCVINDTCLFSAIRQDESVLRGSSTDEDKWKSLKYLGHWFGDIHQPLHVSFKDDRGGNQVLLENGIGCRKKLHSVWDQCIPEDLMQAMDLDPDDTSQREDFGQMLHSEITDDQRIEWTSEMRLDKIAGESFWQARQPEVQYCVRDGNKCKYTKTDLEHISHGEEENTRTIELTGAYEDQFHDVIRARIQAAGVRLGAMLNDIYP